MKYNELSNTAKRKALNDQCERAMSYEWWAPVYEDFASVAECLGLELDTVSTRTKDSPLAYFDLYARTCVFAARFCPEYDGKCVERIKEYAPQDEELLRIAQALQDASAPVIAIDQYMSSSTFRVQIALNHRGSMMYIDWPCIDSIDMGDIEAESCMEIERLCDAFDKAVLNCCLDLASWLLERLREEEESLCSEERLIEDAFDFDEDGNVV